MYFLITIFARPTTLQYNGNLIKICTLTLQGINNFDSISCISSKLKHGRNTQITDNKRCLSRKVYISCCCSVTLEVVSTSVLNKIQWRWWILQLNRSPYHQRSYEILKHEYPPPLLLPLSGTVFHYEREKQQVNKKK